MKIRILRKAQVVRDLQRERLKILQLQDSLQSAWRLVNTDQKQKANDTISDILLVVKKDLAFLDAALQKLK